MLCSNYIYTRTAGQSINTCFYPRNKYMKEDHIIFKEKETKPSVFNHTSVIGDEVKISYTVRLKTSTWSLNHFSQGIM